MKKIICWGTGKQAEKVLRYLPFELYEILFFVDRDEEKWGKTIDSFMIKSPYSIVEHIDACDFVLITSGYWQQIFEECVKLGICADKIRYFDVSDSRIKGVDEMYADKVLSQDGEEVYLKGRFIGKERGVYIDVGAFHPYRFSNTYWAYKQGWRGINIEPNHDNYRLLCDLRPEDININCGISDDEGQMDYYVFKEGALNTFCSDEIIHKDEIIGVHKVATRRLDSIFEEYGIKEIEYIDIDVEGMELKVLRSIDWDKVCISCVLVEQRRMSLLDVVRSEVCEYLKSKGYIPISKYNRTVIYEKE